MIDKKDIIQELDEEVLGTRAMLGRVPFEKLDFKPSPKSMPLGQLAFMVASMPRWITSIVQEDSIDAGTFKQPPQPKSADNLVHTFDTGIEEARRAVEGMNEASLDALWSFKMKGKVIMELPRRVVLRQTVNHLVHHRAQLGVYLKMNGVPHPALYGPSGDEQ